jgi:starch-binding outer membrane protein, SusD/RagB family
LRFNIKYKIDIIMKKYFFISSIIIFSILSCSDFLEEESRGVPTFGPAQSDSEVISLTSALYILNNNEGPAIEDRGLYGRGAHLYSLIPSDDFVVGKEKGQIEDIKNFKAALGSYTRFIWPLHFVVIKRANDIIRDLSDNGAISQNVKDFALGQAYFIRGLAYFQLSLFYGDDETYGGIPIVDENTVDFLITRPTSVKESYEFAAESFTKAAELLPYFDNEEYFAQGTDGIAAGKGLGRAHKNAALGYLARTHLHNAEFDAASWQKVIDACDEVIDSGKNSLEANFEDAFKMENNWGPEYLWSVPSNTRGGSMFPGASLENRGWGKYNGWGYFAPTLDLYESYEAGDERRDATLLAYGDEFEYFGETRRYWSNTDQDETTGFQLRKFMDPFKAPGGINLNPNDGAFPTTNLNLPLLRYSHILLMKAEAEITLNGAGAGDTEVNLVRARAGLPSKTGATMDDLKAERRAEFAGELFGRYEDLCRWGNTADITKALRGRFHDDLGDPDSNFTIREVWPETPLFDLSTHRIWPIPETAIGSSEGTLTPNGW